MEISKEQEWCLDRDGVRDVQPKQLMMYDGGKLTSVVVKAGNWMRDGDCETHGVTKLGYQMDTLQSRRQPLLHHYSGKDKSTPAHTQTDKRMGGTEDKRGSPRSYPSETGCHGCYARRVSGRVCVPRQYHNMRRRRHTVRSIGLEDSPVVSDVGPVPGCCWVCVAQYRVLAGAQGLH